MASPLVLTAKQLDILKSIDDKLESALSAGVSDGISVIYDPVTNYADDNALGGGDHDKAEKVRAGIKTFLKLGLAALVSQLDEVDPLEISTGTSNQTLIGLSSE